MSNNEIDFDNPVPFETMFPQFVDLVGCSTMDPNSSRKILARRLEVLQKWVHAPCFIYPDADMEKFGREYLFKLWNYLLIDRVWEDSSRQGADRPNLDPALPFICDLLCSLASRTEFDLLQLLPIGTKNNNLPRGDRRLTPAEATARHKRLKKSSDPQDSANSSPSAPVVISFLPFNQLLSDLQRYRRLLLQTLRLCLRLMNYFYPRHLLVLDKAKSIMLDGTRKKQMEQQQKLEQQKLQGSNSQSSSSTLNNPDVKVPRVSSRPSRTHSFARSSSFDFADASAANLIATEGHQPTGVATASSEAPMTSIKVDPDTGLPLESLAKTLGQSDAQLAAALGAVAVSTPAVETRIRKTSMEIDLLGKEPNPESGFEDESTHLSMVGATGTTEEKTVVNNSASDGLQVESGEGLPVDHLINYQNPSQEDDRAEEWAYFDKLCAHILAVSFFALPDVLGGPMLLVLTNPLPAIEALLRDKSNLKHDAPRKVRIVSDGKGQLMLIPASRRTRTPSNNQSADCAINAITEVERKEERSSVSSTSAGRAVSTSIASKPLPLWIRKAILELNHLMPIVTVTRPLGTAPSGPQQPGSPLLAGSPTPMQRMSTSLATTQCSTSKLLYAPVRAPSTPPSMVAFYPRCCYNSEGTNPSDDAATFMKNHPSLFEWTRPDFFLASTPKFSSPARTRSIGSVEEAGDDDEAEVRWRRKQREAAEGDPLKMHQNAASSNAPRTSEVEVLDNDFPVLLPTAASVLEAHLADPEFYFVFSGLWFSHVKRLAQGEIIWSLVPGYWQFVQRFTELLLLYHRNYFTHPDVLWCQDAILSNQPAGAHMIGFFSRLIMMSTMATSRESIERCWSVLALWFSRLSLDQAKGWDALTAPLPNSFPHSMLVDALLLCVRLDHFQVLLKVCSFIYMQMGHLYDEARIELLERVILDPTVFLELFLHWCSEVRKVFHYILLYRLKRGANYQAYLPAAAVLREIIALALSAPARVPGSPAPDVKIPAIENLKPEENVYVAQMLVRAFRLSTSTVTPPGAGTAIISQAKLQGALATAKARLLAANPNAKPTLAELMQQPELNNAFYELYMAALCRDTQPPESPEHCLGCLAPWFQGAPLGQIDFAELDGRPMDSDEDSESEDPNTFSRPPVAAPREPRALSASPPSDSQGSIFTRFASLLFGGDDAKATNTVSQPKPGSPPSASEAARSEPETKFSAQDKSVAATSAATTSITMAPAPPTAIPLNLKQARRPKRKSKGKAVAATQDGNKGSAPAAAPELTPESCTISHSLLTIKEQAMDMMYVSLLDQMLIDLRMQDEYGWSIGADQRQDAEAAARRKAKADERIRLLGGTGYGGGTFDAYLTSLDPSRPMGMLVVPARLRPYLRASLQEFEENERVYLSLQQLGFPEPPSTIRPAEVPRKKTTTGPVPKSSASSQPSLGEMEAHSPLTFTDPMPAPPTHAFVRMPQIHFAIESKPTGIN